MEKKVKTITIQVSEEEHKEAKVVAANAGKTLKQIFLEAIAKLRKQQDNK